MLVDKDSELQKVRKVVWTIRRRLEDRVLCDLNWLSLGSSALFVSLMVSNYLAESLIALEVDLLACMHG